MAAQLQLDLGAFGSDTDAVDVAQRLDADGTEAEALKVAGVPAVLLNGTRRLTLPVSTRFTRPSGLPSRGPRRGGRSHPLPAVSCQLVRCGISWPSHGRRPHRFPTPRLPRDGQADRADLQPRLPLLLLPREGAPLPAARQAGRCRRCSRRSSATTSPRRYPGGHLRLAGRGADAAWRRLLPPGRRVAAALRRRPADRERASRPMASWSTMGGRRSSPSTGSWWGCRSTARATCTTATAWTRRQPDVRPRDEGHGRAEAAWRGVQHADGRSPRQRAGAPRGLPVPEGTRAAGFFSSSRLSSALKRRPLSEPGLAGRGRVAAWSVDPADWAGSCAASSTSGCGTTSVALPCRSSMSRSNVDRLPQARCVFRETCGARSPSSTTAISTPATTTCIPRFRLGNVIDDQLGDAGASPAQRRFGDAKRDTLPDYCRSATCGSPATASAPRTASPTRQTASRASTTSAPATSASSVTSIRYALHGQRVSREACARKRDGVGRRARPPACGRRSRPQRSLSVRVGEEAQEVLRCQSGLTMVSQV